jgi:hypothetical protein
MTQGARRALSWQKPTKRSERQSFRRRLLWRTIQMMMMRSMKMMWMCVAAVGLAIILAASGVVGFAALFAIPCLLMMGAMVWMMLRMGGGSHHGESK